MYGLLEIQQLKAPSIKFNTDKSFHLLPASHLLYQTNFNCINYPKGLTSEQTHTRCNLRSCPGTLRHVDPLVSERPTLWPPLETDHRLSVCSSVKAETHHTETKELEVWPVHFICNFTSILLVCSLHTQLMLRAHHQRTFIRLHTARSVDTKGIIDCFHIFSRTNAWNNHQ